MRRRRITTSTSCGRVKTSTRGVNAADLTERAEDGPAGEQGGIPPQDADKKDLKILIPLEPGEMDKAIEPGKGAPIDRKG